MYVSLISVSVCVALQASHPRLQSATAFHTHLPFDSLTPNDRVAAPQMDSAHPRTSMGRTQGAWNSNMQSSPGLWLDGILQSSSGLPDRFNHYEAQSFSPSGPQTLPSTYGPSYEVSPDPISRFRDIEGPWVPRGIVEVPQGEMQLPKDYGSILTQAGYRHHSSSFDRYQTKTTSEFESDVTGPYPSDSGYGTKSQATASILSTEQVDHGCEEASLSGRMDDFSLSVATSVPAYSQADGQRVTRQTDFQANHAPRQGASLQCPFPECGNVLHCQSELK